MLYTPTTNRRSKRGYFGIVTSNTPHGPRLRALSFPVQTLTKPSVNWRHIFLTAKRNWLSLVANNTTTWPLSGYTDAQLWEILNQGYNGVLQAGLIENGLITMALQVGCVDGAAYFQLVQTNRASLSLPPLAPPPVVNPALPYPAGTQTPSFAFPNSLTATSEYDALFNVTGFVLTYTWYGGLLYPMSYGGVAYGGLWEIVASDAYKSGATPPAAGAWSPILFAGPGLPSPAQVLTAWINVFGQLPQQGSIKLQIFPLDPVSGTSGPALSATVGWKQGTLHGAARSSITGPLFAFSTAPSAVSITAPGTQTTAFSLYGLNGYGGTIVCELKSSSVIATGYNNAKKFLPTGITATFSPPSVTIPPGSSTPIAVTLNIAAASGAQQFNDSVRVSATDGLTTTSRAFNLLLSGAVTPQPPPNYLSISPGGATSPITSPSTAAVDYTLTNTGPDDIQVAMQAECPLPAIGLEFAALATAVATATATTMTFALPNSAGVNGLFGQTLSSVGYSPAAYNVTDAIIVASTNTTATIDTTANPGPTTVTGVAGLVGAALLVTAQTTAHLATPPITIPGLDALIDGTGSQFSPALPISNSFVGWYIQTAGWAPASLNQGPTPITSQTGGIFHTAVTGAYAPQTLVGTLTLTNPNSVANVPPPYIKLDTPGAAALSLAITIPAGVGSTPAPIQVTAAAGANTAQAGIYLV